MTKGSPVSIIPGFEDLKPKDVLVFNANGTVMLEVNGKIELYQMQISPTGNFISRPIERDKPLDQPQQRRAITREQRLAMTDQGQQLLGG
jgi:hypothetical protein